jgi:hypothetical protein
MALRCLVHSSATITPSRISRLQVLTRLQSPGCSIDGGQGGAQESKKVCANMGHQVLLHCSIQTECLATTEGKLLRVV